MSKENYRAQDVVCPSGPRLLCWRMSLFHSMCPRARLSPCLGEYDKIGPAEILSCQLATLEVIMRPSALGHHMERNIRYLPIQQAQASAGISLERHADVLRVDHMISRIGIGSS